MRSACFLWFVPLVLLVSARMSSSQSAPVVPKEPATFLEPFRLNPSGTLAPLEKVRSIELRKGRGVAFFVQGDASPVEFANDEPNAFVVRIMGVPKLEELQKQPPLKLEVLAVRDRMRFATGRFVPMEVKRYGTSSFQFTPRVTLPLGEYALSQNGLFGAEGSGIQLSGWAFRIFER